MHRSITHLISGTHPRFAAPRVLPWLLAILALSLGSSGLAAQAPSRAPAAQPQFKGVFEPVSFTEDIYLLDVFFVNTNVGWAAGKAGTIIHTTNGGAAWTAQLGGDPQNTGDPIRLLRFLDERHGWAVQGGGGNHPKLLHTSDGESWEEIGTPPYGINDLVFTSTTVGFMAAKTSEMSQGANSIYRTTDGGRTWKNIWTCNAKVSLGGLSKTLSCQVVKFSFPTPQVGYAAVRNTCMGAGCEGPPLIAKTTDGGESWEAVLGPGTGDREAMTSVFFLNEQSGFARLNTRKLHMTTDGGTTWRGIVASPGEAIRFADPGVGWAVNFDNRLDLAVWFTTDGGSRWSSRTIRFPADAYAFSFPRRDRAYIVGEHGMVFRYSVVPASRSLGPNDIAAPAMPGFESALESQVTQLEQVVTELRTSLNSAPSASGGSAASGTTASGASASSSDAGAGAGGDDSESFSVPLAPASPFTANCCNKSFSRLEVILGAMSKTLPEFIGKYKNLNLLLAAVRMGAELPNEYRSVKGGLSAFRKAQDKEGATAALSAVSAALSAFKQTTAVSMQKALPPASGG